MKVEFTNGCVVELEDGKNLSEVLDTTNSPVLFGCRTGICGTCVVKVIEGAGSVDEPSSDELEVLELCKGEGKDTRLSCLMKCNGDVKLEYLGK